MTKRIKKLIENLKNSDEMWEVVKRDGDFGPMFRLREEGISEGDLISSEKIAEILEDWFEAVDIELQWFNGANNEEKYDYDMYEKIRRDYIHLYFSDNANMYRYWDESEFKAFRSKVKRYEIDEDAIYNYISKEIDKICNENEKIKKIFRFYTEHELRDKIIKRAKKFLQESKRVNEFIFALERIDDKEIGFYIKVKREKGVGKIVKLQFGLFTKEDLEKMEVVFNRIPDWERKYLDV